MSPPNDRVTAIRLIADWLDFDALPSLTLQGYQTVTPFLNELVLGTVRMRGALDWAVCQLTASYPKDLLLPPLYVGLYQILYMNQPAHAVVHETIEAAKVLKPRSPVGFFNGVFRSALRKRESLLEDLARAPLTAQFSHPAFLVQTWQKNHGLEKARSIMTWNNQRPDLWIRLVNEQDVDEYLRDLDHKDIPYQRLEHVNGTWLRLLEHPKVSGLPGYKQGRFYVQDPSTAYASHLLAAQPGEVIFDVCAAPGGKAVMIAEAMQGRGVLVLADCHADRIKLLRQNCKRMRLQDAHIVEADFTKPEAQRVFNQVHAGGVDALLLDVPCSNTGVLRRRPEARWHVDPERLQRLWATQAHLLDAAVPWIKEGGRLVYSTCSMEPSENEGQVQQFLERHPCFALEDAVSILPGEKNSDGCYAARLRRVTSG